MNIIEIIKNNSLTIRCLPSVVVSYWTYHEGDERRTWVDSNGEPSKAKRTVVIRPHDGKKLLREEKPVEHAGWWLVAETKNTNSAVHFSFKKGRGTFMAPTLEEAIELYLKSKI